MKQEQPMLPKDEIVAVIDYNALQKDAEGTDIHQRVVDLINAHPEDVDYNKFRQELTRLHSKKLVADQRQRYLSSLEDKLHKLKKGVNWLV